MKESKVYFLELGVPNKSKFVCDITEKFYQQNKSVCIYTENQRSATQLDQLLWTWKQDSFIPHSVLNRREDERIIICSDSDTIMEADVLILYDPLDQSAFSKYVHVVDFAELYDDQRLQKSRQRFKSVRDAGKFQIEFLKLGAFLNRQL